MRGLSINYLVNYYIIRYDIVSSIYKHIYTCIVCHFVFIVLQDRELWIAARDDNKYRVIDAIDRGADVNYKYFVSISITVQYLTSNYTSCYILLRLTPLDDVYM